MDNDVGVACGSCDTYGPLKARFCESCGAEIALIDEPGPQTADMLNPLVADQLADLPPGATPLPHPS